MDLLEAVAAAPALTAKRVLGAAFTGFLILLGLILLSASVVAGAAASGVPLWGALMMGSAFLFICAGISAVITRSAWARAEHRGISNGAWTSVAAAMSENAARAPVKAMLGGVVAGLTLGALDSLNGSRRR